MSKVVEIYPKYSYISSNSYYGHTYEDILINNSLLKVDGLKLMNDPEIYREEGRRLRGLKIIYSFSNNKCSDSEMTSQVLLKKNNGDFIVLPENNAESDIKIDKTIYKIRYFKKQLYLSQFHNYNNHNSYNNNKCLHYISKGFKNKIYKVYNPYNNYNYYFDINRLNSYRGNNDQKDKLQYIGVFQKCMLFFFKSKCEVDGLFLVTQKFNISIYECKVLSSCFNNKEENGVIQANSFLIYEAKSYDDINKLIETIKYRMKFVEGLLYYYNKKYSIKDIPTYIGFFRSKEKIICPKEYALKDKNMNVAILQNDEFLFGKNVVFVREELVQINEIKNQISNMDQKIDEMNSESNKKFDEMNKKIDEMDKKIDEMDKKNEKKFDEMNKKIDEMDKKNEKKFDEMNKKFDKMDKKIESILDFISILKPQFITKKEENKENDKKLDEDEDENEKKKKKENNTENTNIDNDSSINQAKKNNPDFQYQENIIKKGLKSK